MLGQFLTHVDNGNVIYFELYSEHNFLTLMTGADLTLNLQSLHASV